MTQKAIVIRTVGDPQIAGAIVDGMTRRVIRLNESELAAVKAECARLRAKDDIRTYGDSVRFESACKALEVKYKPEHHGALYWAVLRAWALLWLGISTAYNYFSQWNREP